MPTPPTAVNRLGVVTSGPGSAPPFRVVLDAVAFDNGEFAGPDHADAFESWSMRLNAEKALATILPAARNDPSKHDSAWEAVNKVADQLKIDNPPQGPIRRSGPPSPEAPFAYTLINTRRLRGCTPACASMRAPTTDRARGRKTERSAMCLFPTRYGLKSINGRQQCRGICCSRRLPASCTAGTEMPIQGVLERARTATGIQDLTFRRCRTTFATLYEGDPVTLKPSSGTPQST